MDVEDHTEPVADAELQTALERLVAVVDGIVPFHLHCTCGRLYKLAAREEMATLLATVRRAIRERTGVDPLPETSRFSLLEVDV
jgi:hypothetical protein